MPVRQGAVVGTTGGSRDTFERRKDFIRRKGESVMQTAKLGDLVRIYYSRVPQPGSASDKPRGRRALEFIVGSSEMLAGLSLGVVGMASGERRRLTLPPEEAYGRIRPALIREIPNQRVPQHIVLSIGKRLTAIERVSRRRRRVRVVEIRPECVVVDGNHLLAGKVVELEVLLITIDSSCNTNQSKPQFDVGGEG
jgi:peptidylprolyl isomerase